MKSNLGPLQPRAISWVLEDREEAIEVRTSGRILRQGLERNGQEESKKFLKLVSIVYENVSKKIKTFAGKFISNVFR